MQATATDDPKSGLPVQGALQRRYVPAVDSLKHLSEALNCSTTGSFEAADRTRVSSSHGIADGGTLEVELGRMQLLGGSPTGGAYKTLGLVVSRGTLN